MSLNLEPEDQVAALDALHAEFEAQGVPIKEVRGVIAFRWSMIPTEINSF